MAKISFTTESAEGPQREQKGKLAGLEEDRIPVLGGGAKGTALQLF
jgi:hypothetical protein